MRLHSLYARRVPEAEETDVRLDELLKHFAKHSGASASRGELLSYSVQQRADLAVAFRNSFSFRSPSARVSSRPQN